MIISYFLENEQKNEVNFLDPVYSAVYLAVMRYAFAPMGAVILLRCGSDLLKGRQHSGHDVASLVWLTLFQGLNAFGFWLVGQKMAVICYWVIAMLQWLMLLAYVLVGKSGFALETMAFLLCSLGLGAVITVRPEEGMKQTVAIALGVAVYLMILWLMTHEKQMRKVGYGAAVLGLMLPVLALVLGEEYYGAKSWVMIGPFSVQPSEIGKVCFIYAVAMFLQMKKIGLLVLYGGAICLFLIWSNDFGAAAVYFAALLTMVFLHSGFIIAAGLAVAGTGLAMWRMPAHALRRIAVWRHIWEQPLHGGYQQTRALMCMAAGGLFGLGFGNGRMESVFAADSDMVFAAFCEVWGLLAGVLPIAALGLLVIYGVKRSGKTEDFSAIAGCGAATVLAVQGALNVLGSVDVLPMTGVTLPFVSNGGTAMVAAWGMMALIKKMEREQEENGWRNGLRHCS